jgi:molecular chaperone DnaK (HSP70)
MAPRTKPARSVRPDRHSSAPRGVPQVSHLRIDANGIVSVTAKDKATSKGNRSASGIGRSFGADIRRWSGSREPRG